MEKHKPIGYWTKANVIKETKKIIIQEGGMPSQKRLSQLGMHSINKCCQKYFGGLNGLAEVCGVNPNKRYNYWKDINNLKVAIEGVKSLIGRFPTADDLRFLGRQDLLMGIMQAHGGFRKVRKKLGYTQSYPVAKDGHFCDSYLEVIVDDFLFVNKILHQRNIQFNFNSIKCRPDFIVGEKLLIEVLMADYRNNNLGEWHTRYVKRYNKKRQAYIENGFEVIEVFPEEFVDKEKLENKLLYILDKVQSSSRITSNFSKYILFSKKSPGYWHNINNLKKELLPIIKKYGDIPTCKVLRSIKRNDVAGAIWMFMVLVKK